MLRWLSGRLSAVAFSTLLISAISSGAARADDCSSEKTLKSSASNAATSLSFQNKSAEKRRLYWMDQDGDRKFYGVVEPGNAFKQPTFAGHAWVVTDDVEKCLYTFVATPDPLVVDVGVAAANVVAPPPGGQAPIAQTPPPAVVAAPTAPVAPPAVVQPPVEQATQVAPPAAVVQAPQIVAPPSLPPSPLMQAFAEDPVGEASPVEQFQLRGAYRLVTQLDNTKVLNNDPSGTIFVVAVQPEWDSAQWTFEAVPGTPFVRIKNVWKKNYLADFNGKARAMPAAPNATEAQWTFEPVDGTNFVQFRNRETGRFLLAINGAVALVEDLRKDMENNTHWRTAPVSGGSAVTAAVIPQRPLYDDALANCRRIGGSWTGSSCRRPVYITEPLVCPRGFVWAEDVGECLWDGDRCPPWQLGPGGACGVNLTCNGGAVAPGRRGFPACYCPPGAVAWGNYPNLSCVPSVTRIAPYLVPVAIAGVTIGILGQVYGNNQVCPLGQTGTPPNCRTAATCPSPLVGTPPNCQRLVPRPVSVCPAGQTGTPPNCVIPTPVVTTCPAGQTGTPPNCRPIVTACPAGTTGTPPNCVPIVTACPAGTTGTPPNCTPVVTACPAGQTGTPPNCVPIVTACPAGTTGTPPNCAPTNAPACPAGQTGTLPNCTPIVTACPAGQTGTPPNCRPIATTCPAGQTGTPPNCTPIVTACPAGQTGTPPNCTPLAAACPANSTGRQPNCVCNAGFSGPTCAPDAPCAPWQTKNAAGKCVDPPCIGGNYGSGVCNCPNGQRAVNNVCTRLSCSGGQMVGEQCRCNDQTQTPVKTSFSSWACVAGAATGACPSDSTGKPPSCVCNAGTTGQPGNCQKPCPAGQIGTPPNCQVPPGQLRVQSCPAGQTGTPPNCVTPPVVTTCPAGQTGAPPNCKAAAPLTPPACPAGTTGTAPNCVAVQQTCPAGQTGTPPNCKAAVPLTPPTCPAGTTGTPPNCRAPTAPPTCPAGTTGTPPNCVATPATCPAGQTGTPPNCKAAAPITPPTCPTGTTGTPPNCRAIPPPTCPAGTTGTPPNCRAIPPPTCPAGTTGTPPNCRAPQVIQQQQPCAPPKKVNPQGQCV